MNLQGIINGDANVVVVCTASDLKEFAEYLLNSRTDKKEDNDEELTTDEVMRMIGSSNYYFLSDVKKNSCWLRPIKAGGEYGELGRKAYTRAFIYSPECRFKKSDVLKCIDFLHEEKLREIECNKIRR